MQLLKDANRGCQTPGAGITGCWEPSVGVRPEPGPLPKEPVLLRLSLLASPRTSVLKSGQPETARKPESAVKAMALWKKKPLPSRLLRVLWHWVDPPGDPHAGLVNTRSLTAVTSELE